MSFRTPYKRSKVIDSIVPASQTGDVNGTAVDIKGWTWLRVFLHLGAEASSEAISLKLQSSSDNAVLDAFADITDGPTFGPTSTSGAAGDKPKEFLVFIPTSGYERYVRPVVTQTGSGTFVYGVSVELLDPVSTDLATQTPNTTVLA